jgi:hypothetical protein
MRHVGRPRALGGIAIGLVVVASVAAPAAADRGDTVVPDEVHRKAVTTGSARVIVQLRLAPPAGDDAERRGPAGDQRAAIHRAQSAVLAELEATGYRLLRRYETIPFLALEVSPQALDVLKQSSLVVRIEEDRAEPPRTGIDCRN